jgi:nicotinamidase/pyrazinamidase
MRIFYDVDTQNDFMNNNGALYVPGTEEIKPNLSKLTKYAIANHVPVLGSVDRHFGTEEYRERERELKRWGGPFPDHCMANTEGELKIPETTLFTQFYSPKDVCYPDRMNGDWVGDEAFYVSHLKESMPVELQLKWAPRVVLARKTLLYPERRVPKSIIIPILFEKQSYDVFSNPAADYVMREFGRSHKFGGGPAEAVVYGVATDYCVKAAVLGMQRRGIQCYVVKDAIKGITPESEREALEEMIKAEAKLVTTEDILEERT